ncbi:MAG: cyclic nucleotide-binding domain-containing protein [Candidatus Dormibacterales bacterium]
MNEGEPEGKGPEPEELRGRFAVLSRVAILFTLPDSRLRELTRHLRPATVTTGTVVVRQGDPGDALFIIEEGRCEVVVQESPGHSVTVAFLGSGDFFGEMALVSEEPRSATVRALTDCRLLVLDRKTLYEMVPADSEALIDLHALAEQRKATLQNVIAHAGAVAPEQAAICIAVYSPKGGAGKTTVAVNLAASLGRIYPGEVLLFDLALPFNHAALTSKLVPTSSLGTVLSQGPTTNFEEAILSSILHHPSGMMVLPGVLKPEEADLITPDVLIRAITLLRGAFRYIVFDLGVAMTENLLTVLDHSQKIVLIAIPELSTLKDITDLYRIFASALHILPSQVLVTMNVKSPRAVVSRDDVERNLQQEVTVEIGYDGSKPDEAAVRGELLVLTDPKSSVSRGVLALVDALEGRTDPRRERRLPFGFKVG